MWYWIGFINVLYNIFNYRKEINKMKNNKYQLMLDVIVSGLVITYLYLVLV